MSKKYTIIDTHTSGMVELKPTTRSAAKMMITKRGEEVMRQRPYGDRLFRLKPSSHLQKKQLRIRDSELAGKQ